jgi:LysM repeat protein
MGINNLKQFSFIIFTILWFATINLNAQNKSENIQVIDGKKYAIHKIEKGQSLYSISKLYNSSLDVIYADNPELKEGAKAGQEIKIFLGQDINAVQTKTSNIKLESISVNPTETDTLKYKVYKVSKGETIYSITRKFNLSNEYFDKLNPSAKTGLKEGQLVIIGEKSEVLQPVKVYQETVTKSANIKVDTSKAVKINFNKKSDYNIALILPFKLNESNDINPSALAKANQNFPAISSLAVDFYLGFKHAADSLKSQDQNIRFQLFDLDDKDSMNLVNINQQLDKGETDFIFGPLYANGFRSVSQKAKEKHIPIVSPITQMNKFLFNNIYASKTNPSQFTLLESLADYILDSLKTKKAKVIINIGSDKDQKEMSYVRGFKTYYNDKLKKLGYSLKDTVHSVRGIDGVKKNYSDGMKNIVLTFTGNQVLITDFTTQLAIFANKKDITLMGWQSTSTIENIDQEYLNQLNYTYPSQYNYTALSKYNNVTKKYFNEQNTAPSEYYYIGYEVGYYYLYHLLKHGQDFIYHLDELPMDMNYIRFKFNRPDEQTGFDNNGVFILKYQNYQLTDTGWK